MRRALFVCYGGGHATMVIPVVRELTRDGGWEAIVLALTLAGPQVRAAGLPAYGYQDLVRPGDAAAIEHGRRLLADSHDPRSGIPVEESIAYLGLSYQDLVERLGADPAAERYRIHGRHAFLPLGPLRRAIERWRPDVVVTTNSPKSERAALVVAAEAGLPTVGIEDLLGIRQTLIRDFVPPFRPTRLCVGSTIAAGNLVRDEGAEPDTIRLTGNPAFDRLAGIRGRRTEARERLGLVDHSRFAVIYTQAFPRPDGLADLIDELRKVDGLSLGIRRHPSHRSVSAAEFAAALPGEVAILDDAPLDDLLAASDVALSTSSTVMVEALLCGNAVLQLGPRTGVADASRERIEDLPLHEHGAALLVDDLASVADVMRGALFGDAVDQLRERAAVAFVPPGGAAAAIADQVRELAG